MPISIEDVKSICSDLLDLAVEDVEFPGGKSRDAVRVRIADHSFIVTHRKSLRRSQLETAVLRILNQQGAPVPYLIACRDHYLIQQDVGSVRLSQRMQEVSAAHVMTLLGAALQSLHAIHQAGIAVEKLGSLVILGHKPGWLHSFVRSAERLASGLEMPCPHLSHDRLVTLLTVEQPRFIKWDARPGNAIVRNDGQVVWIDWEHCGRRHPIDDVAWLLADEYCPFVADQENALVASILPMFANGYSLEKAHEYLRVFGTFHSCVRLSMILKRQAKDGWGNYQKCLELDQIGVVRELAMQACQRAASWAQQSALTRDLTPWFHDVLARIEKL